MPHCTMNGHFCRVLLGRAPTMPSTPHSATCCWGMRPRPSQRGPPGAVPLLQFLGPVAAYSGLISCAPRPGTLGGYGGPCEPAFIQKRNERERQRVRRVNKGYARFRDHPPTQRAEQRLSKVKTPRAATRYVWPLQGLLCAAPDGPPRERPDDT